MSARKYIAVEPLSFDGAPVAAGESFTTSADIGRQLVAVGAAVRVGQAVPHAQPGRSWRVRGSILERCRAPAAESIEPAPWDRAAELKALASAAGVKGADTVPDAPAAPPEAQQQPNSATGGDRAAEITRLARRVGMKGHGREATDSDRSEPTGRAAELVALARRVGLPGFEP